MKLIIDIPEKTFICLKNMLEAECVDAYSLADIIVNKGTPASTEGDLISREALKTEMQKADIEANDYETLAKMYENCVDNAITVAVNCKDCDGYEAGYSAGLKDAERSQSEWIPVSERLPEINVDVIVTDIETTGTYSAYYQGDGLWECDNGPFKNRVIAWMPFPEPYKEEGTE